MKKEKIKVGPVGVCDIYEVGNWLDSYPWIKLGYKDEYKGKYFDISFCISNNKSIFGYFLSHNIVNLKEGDIIPLYSRKLVLYDFAISSRAYAKYGKILLNYALNYAKKNGYSAIEIKKVDKYSFFFDFIKRHYSVKEFNNSFYFLINNPRIKTSQKHLCLYQEDKVSLDDLYFLYDIKFSIRKTIAKLKLNETESIVIDRKSGLIKFPSNVKINNDRVILNSKTRSIIYLIYTMYKENQVRYLVIDYSLSKPDFFEIYADDLLYINKNSSLLVENISYILNLIDKGIKYISPYVIDYDMNDRMFAINNDILKCMDLVKKYTLKCDSNAKSVLEQIKEEKLRREFNLKLKAIKCFDFRFGNPFCGIKKFTILFANNSLEIKSNGQIEKDVEPNFEELIAELECFNFINWKEKYDENNSPKFENSWTIKLVFDDETKEFIGFDDYPKVWAYVEWFINKYARFKLVKE